MYTTTLGDVAYPQSFAELAMYRKLKTECFFVALYGKQKKEGTKCLGDALIFIFK